MLKISNGGVEITGFSIRRFQAEQRDWAQHNFGELNAVHAFLGMTEELGELAHAVLKQKQGIRGTYDEHEAAAKDAFADFMIYAMNFASARGWDAQEIVERVWGEVKRRDWKRFPKNGLTE